MGTSWSGKRKRLEQDLLAESLKGRVQYFITKYKEMNNSYTFSRFALIVDNKEIIKANYLTYVKGALPLINGCYHDYNPKNNDILREMYNNNLASENLTIITYLLNEDGIFSMWSILESIEAYLNQSIQQSIDDFNPVVRMFAILDRRIGKRTLEKLGQELYLHPAWLQAIYKLRLNAENISIIEQETHNDFSVLEKLSSGKAEIIRLKIYKNHCKTEIDYFNDKILKQRAEIGGHIYSGYIWDVLRNPKSNSEELLLSKISKTKSYYLFTDKHSYSKVFEEEYKSFKKNSIYQLTGQELRGILSFLPTDFYLLSDDYQELYCFTHEEYKKSRYCLYSKSEVD
ncbi:MAG: hypothetical protein QM489_01835 [Candidatus Izemoplasma sp.]